MSTNLGKSLEGCLKERSVTFREYNMVAGLLSFFTVAVGCTRQKGQREKRGSAPFWAPAKKGCTIRKANVGGITLLKAILLFLYGTVRVVRQ